MPKAKAKTADHKMNEQSENSHYYAVIFTRRAKNSDDARYGTLSRRMIELAETMPGFIAVNSANDAMRDDNFAIVVSYWKSLKDIENWKKNSEHLMAQKLGRSDFYRDFSLQVTRVEKSYHMNNPDYHPRP